MLVTRLMLDLTALSLYLTQRFLSAPASEFIEAEKSRVPCISTRFFSTQRALPENLRPSMVRSLRPVRRASTPSVCNASRMGAVNRRNMSPVSSPGSLVSMKVKLTLPRSWNTAPPPESRRTTLIPLALT